MITTWALSNVHLSKEYYHSFFVSSSSLEAFNTYQLGPMYISKTLLYLEALRPKPRNFLSYCQRISRVLEVFFKSSPECWDSMRSQQHSLATFLQCSLKTRYAGIAHFVETSALQYGGEGDVIWKTGHKCLEEERCDCIDLGNNFIISMLIVIVTCVWLQNRVPSFFPTCEENSTGRCWLVHHGTEENRWVERMLSEWKSLIWKKIYFVRNNLSLCHIFLKGII